MIKITDSKNIQLRFDALNVLNHPQPVTPVLAVNTTAPWGQMATKTGGRLFQGSARLTF
jgi:hypothetical protein